MYINQATQLNPAIVPDLLKSDLCRHLVTYFFQLVISLYPLVSCQRFRNLKFVTKLVLPFTVIIIHVWQVDLHLLGLYIYYRCSNSKYNYLTSRLFFTIIRSEMQHNYLTSVGRTTCHHILHNVSLFLLQKTNHIMMSKFEIRHTYFHS